MVHEASRPQTQKLLCHHASTKSPVDRRAAANGAPPVSVRRTPVMGLLVEKHRKVTAQRRSGIGSDAGCSVASLDCAPNRMQINSMLQPAFPLTDLQEKRAHKKLGQTSLAKEPAWTGAPTCLETGEASPCFQQFYKRQPDHATLRTKEVVAGMRASSSGLPIEEFATAAADNADFRPISSRPCNCTPHANVTRSLKASKRVQEIPRDGGHCMPPATLPPIPLGALQGRLHQQQEDVLQQKELARVMAASVPLRMALVYSKVQHQDIPCSLRKCCPGNRSADLRTSSRINSSSMRNRKLKRGTTPELAPDTAENKLLAAAETFRQHGEYQPTVCTTGALNCSTCMRYDSSISFPAQCFGAGQSQRLSASATVYKTEDTEASTVASVVEPSAQFLSDVLSVVRRQSESPLRPFLVKDRLPMMHLVQPASLPAAAVSPALGRMESSGTPEAEVDLGSEEGSRQLSGFVETASAPNITRRLDGEPSVSGPTEELKNSWPQAQWGVQPPFFRCLTTLNLGGPSDGETAATTAAPTPPVLPRTTAALAPVMPNPGEDVGRTAKVQRAYKGSLPDEPRTGKQLAGCISGSPADFRSFELLTTPTSNSYDEEDEQDDEATLALLRHSSVSFVCAGALMSLLERCCAISPFGADEKLQQQNDLTTSPFHCSSRPQISLEEYFLKRMFRHGRLCINEGLLALALLSRFLCKQNALLASALQNGQPLTHQQTEGCGMVKAEGVLSRDNSPEPMLRQATSTIQSDIAAAAARVGFVEFNYLTAHRLLLTAAFLAKKTHRDEHTNIRHWAQTALAVSLGESRLLGKEGSVEAPQGDAATTAEFLYRHAMVMLQNEDTAARGVKKRLQEHQATPESLRRNGKGEDREVEKDLACCMCASCGLSPHVPHEQKGKSAVVPSRDALRQPGPQQQVDDSHAAAPSQPVNEPTPHPTMANDSSSASACRRFSSTGINPGKTIAPWVTKDLVRLPIAAACELTESGKNCLAAWRPSQTSIQAPKCNQQHVILRKSSALLQQPFTERAIGSGKMRALPHSRKAVIDANAIRTRSRASDARTAALLVARRHANNEYLLKPQTRPAAPQGGSCFMELPFCGLHSPGNPDKLAHCSTDFCKASSYSFEEEANLPTETYADPPREPEPGRSLTGFAKAAGVNAHAESGKVMPLTSTESATSVCYEGGEESPQSSQKSPPYKDELQQSCNFTKCWCAS